ncbi:non-hydrolyzing UDP-N-acetylglucosamine 2-epimerase [Spirosoma sp. KUDC1026]|uniref:non-hydrolyzing UDP-N-acetylglucosamine 2-epimerase n=1 Tax=Spirosoma sp. KUDC1026 TaxID=2745947 RepID=UPI0021047A7E|nr:UDP-N-acetylglucosamine 2-epimerase (non-hydrolyzing) [Spirosoma sp. KUDC1026]
MKAAPLHRALMNRSQITPKLVHTGQHYDVRMSAVFFQQLDLPEPDYYLGVSTGTPTQQTAEIMQRFEPILIEEQPDWVVVIGDVTSTLACALAANRLGIRIAHVEAGLRSGDRTMPEEINRILTDALADCLFVTEQAGLDNLRREGINPANVYFVGNVMVDSLIQHRSKASRVNSVRAFGLQSRSYILATMHRPSNVDTQTGLGRILQLIDCASQYRTVVWPVHPRTRANLDKLGLLTQLDTSSNVLLLEPQGYLEFLNLMEHAAVVMTDSGGIQEETTYLRVPCLTFRERTERPVTIELGTNQLVADLNPETARLKLVELLAGRVKPSQLPPLWDGHTADRIVDILVKANEG